MNKIIIALLIVSTIVFSIEISPYSQSVLEENKEYILLSNDVYSLKDVEKPTGMIIQHKETSWEVLDYTDNSENGFTAMTVKNKETGEIVVSYGGTADLKDVVEDLSILAIKSDGKQFVAALDYIKEVQEKYPNSNIELTGHSLGGALASYAGLQTGLRTVGINSAPITLSENAMMNLEEEGKSNLFSKTNQNNITNLRTNDDVVSISSKAVEKMSELKQYFEKDKIIFDTRPGKEVTVFTWTGLDASYSLYAKMKKSTALKLFSKAGLSLLIGNYIVGGHKITPLIEKAFPEESANTVLLPSVNKFSQKPIGSKIRNLKVNRDNSSKQLINSVKIQNSKIISSTIIGKKVIVRNNTNLGIEIKSKKINIQNSFIKSNTKIDKKTTISKSNLGNKVTGKNVNIKNSKLITKTIIGRNTRIKNSNLGNNLNGKLSNVRSVTSVNVGKNSTIKNSDLGVTVGN